MLSETSVGRDIIGQSSVLLRCGGQELGVMGRATDRQVPSGDVVHLFVFRFSANFFKFSGKLHFCTLNPKEKIVPFYWFLNF